MAVVGFATNGCEMQPGMQAVAAGYAACRANEIRVENEHYGAGYLEWDAWCKDEQWHCAGSGPALRCRRVESQPVPITAMTPPPPEQKPSAPKWVTYESANCGVSARFPAEPKPEIHELISAERHGPLDIEEAIYEKPDGSGAMDLACAVVGNMDATQKRLLDGARNGMLAKIKGKLVDERPIVGGREVSFQVEDRRALARILLDGDKVVMALVMPVDAFPKASTERFLTSVKAL